ncbi:DUF4326 domain-containing protein [Streptomyces sp. A012304]|uniref:DUF4326 domain-containing protein n=1 Tax=Streptomyces sp. A012304 TaxID=375446 RepID=UPI0028022E1C|nr:DUF4326 domain-containing protein [Streptomyces sp. A012304]GKQ35815.1 hypothetical protein ALMP_23580 [Streptomyces sp. A012304]
MTTIVINLKGRTHDYGPRLEHAPNGLVYVGRRFTMGGWNLEAHPLANPYALKEYGTPEAAVAAYIRYLLDRPELLDQAATLKGRVLACWCTPAICHAHAIAMYADNPSRGRLAEYAADLEWAAGLVEQSLFNRLEASP